MSYENDETPDMKPQDRLERLGYGFRKPAVLKELTAKHKLLAQYMIVGCEHSWIRQFNVEAGVPLRLEVAADALRIRRRNARQLMKEPLFQKYLAAELQALREGHKAEALHTVINVMRDPGEGTAADKKTQLQASQIILGDGEGNRASVNVSINSGGAPLAAGIVIRLPAGTEQRPLEAKANIIDGSISANKESD